MLDMYDGQVRRNLHQEIATEEPKCIAVPTRGARLFQYYSTAAPPVRATRKGSDGEAWSRYSTLLVHSNTVVPTVTFGPVQLGLARVASYGGAPRCHFQLENLN